MTTILHAVHPVVDPPVVDPPAWVTSGPDDNLNFDGPSVEIARLGLTVSTAWSPRDGATLWMDALLYGGGDLSPVEARRLASALLQGAEMLEVSA